MSNLQLRLISAIILIPIVFGAIIFGSWIFTALLGVAFFISLCEWISLSRRTDSKLQFLLFGFIYLPLCFYSFYYLRTGFGDGLYLVLTMLLVIWAADTGAYFVGRKFGKHKMAPSISPNKSWEGMVGAIISSSLVLWALTFFAPHLTAVIPNTISSPVGPEHLWILLFGGILAYIGQGGDLLESFLKRRAGAKDSSKLIPGHGGILDRVDSLLIIAPFFVFIAKNVF